MYFNLFREMRRKHVDWVDPDCLVIHVGRISWLSLTAEMTSVLVELTSV